MTMLPRVDDASRLAGAHRIVIKIGSSSLTVSDGGLDLNRIAMLAKGVRQLHDSGTEVVVVTSGAIAAGLAPLGFTQRPADLTLAQAAASVGQSLLIDEYERAFGRYGILVGQILLTELDLVRRETYRNARGALEALLRLRAVPIVNENDAVATGEIRFGDNDRLAALVAQQLKADVLVLLTDVDGLYTAPPSEPGARRIAEVVSDEDLAGITIGDVGSRVGTGGMITKLDAATIARSTGSGVLLASTDDLPALLDGADRGTWFTPRPSERRQSRLMWLRHATRGAGTVTVDQGAAEALQHRGKSLLAVGITGVEGTFRGGIPVDVNGPDGSLIARGITDYSSTEIDAMRGLSTALVKEKLGKGFSRPVVHRDDMVLIRRT